MYKELKRASVEVTSFQLNRNLKYGTNEKKIIKQYWNLYSSLFNPVCFLRTSKFLDQNKKRTLYILHMEIRIKIVGI